MGDAVEVLETNPYLTSEYLLNFTSEDLQASGIASVTKVIPDSDVYYPGCTEYAISTSGMVIAAVVISPETGKVYLKSRYGDRRDKTYSLSVAAAIRAGLAKNKKP